MLTAGALPAEIVSMLQKAPFNRTEQAAVAKFKEHMRHLAGKHAVPFRAINRAYVEQDSLTGSIKLVG
jgi:hypothetical protein